jgi:hypothetical protein
VSYTNTTKFTTTQKQLGINKKINESLLLLLFQLSTQTQYEQQHQQEQEPILNLNSFSLFSQLNGAFSNINTKPFFNFTLSLQQAM